MSAKAGGAAVRGLAAEFWEFAMREAPTWATFLGDRRYEDRLEERGPEARARQLSAQEDLFARVRKVPARGLAEEDAITRDVLVLLLSDGVEAFEHRGWEWECNQLNGLHMDLQDLLAVHPLRDARGAGNLVARFEAIPAAFLQHKGNLREGLASGRVVPRVAYDRVVSQLRAFAAARPEETTFGRAAAGIAKSVGGAAGKRLSARALEAVRALVVPAFRDFGAFLETEYAGKAREEPGLHAVPGGREAYAFAVRNQTTTDLSPEAIHAIGLEELERNKSEMLAIARRNGHSGDLRSYLDGLMGDPRHSLPTRGRLLSRYRAILRRMDRALPRAFRLLPRTPYRVEPMPSFKEKDAPAAYYYPPSDDGKRPGVFYANLHDPPSWRTYMMETLSFHEAVPGHHLQVALAQEQRRLPAVRRHSLFTAYVEGWAHYTERLCDEMGMYSCDEARVGMLADQAWRAARLVVDTGLHFHGWPREKAVALLREIKTGPEAETHNEVDRYIVWPGQALSYKVGHRRIVDVREKARAALGDRFDLRSFHDEVLRHGALPLSVLEDVVGAWAKSAAKAG